MENISRLCYTPNLWTLGEMALPLKLREEILWDLKRIHIDLYLEDWIPIHLRDLEFCTYKLARDNQLKK